MRLLSATLTALLLPPSAAVSAQSVTTAVEFGDPVTGVGTVNDIFDLAISDSAEWLVFAGTTNPDETIDNVLIRNGFLTLQEGAYLGLPVGSRVDDFRSINIDSRGDSGWELRLENAPVANGLYFNTRMVLLEQDPAPAPFSSGSVYLAFNRLTRFNDSWQMLVLCSVADSEIPGFSDDALVVVSTDENGQLLDQRVVAYEAGVLSGQTVPVKGLTGNKTSFALNDLGEAMFVARLDPPTISDVAIYIDDRKVAQENEPSPLAGRNYANLIGARVDLNNRGDYVFDVGLTGSGNTDRLIVKNGQKVVQELDFSVTNDRFQSFGSGTPIELTSAGDVVYYANMTGPTAQDEAIFFNDQIIVREGVTQVGVKTVMTLTNAAQSFSVSPSGRFMIFSATTFDPISGDLLEGSYVVDLGAVEIVDGCYGNLPMLRRTGGFPVQGDTLTVSMDDAQAAGSIPLVLVSDRLVPGAPPCGILINSGELLIDFAAPGNPIDAFLGVTWEGGPVQLDIPIPQILGLTGVSLYLQGLFLDSLATTTQRLALSNALRIEIGAP